MSKFKALFGIENRHVRGTCILMPFIRKDILIRLGGLKLISGKLYSSAQSKCFTLINTGPHQAFVGDAVLYLRDTPCKSVILFGSCGLVKEKDGLSLGSLVSPFKCYSNESFSQMLKNEKMTGRVYFPDKQLLDSLLNAGKEHKIKKVVCSTVSSLKLEEERLDSFKASGIEVLDMECSAFFAAAKYVNKKAAAIFYVSDVVRDKPFYSNFNLAHKAILASSVDSALRILCEFLRRK